MSKEKKITNGKRGVVFVKELVPKWALSFVANTFYKEHYQTVPMRHNWNKIENKISVKYEWKNGDNWQQIEVNASMDKTEINEGSEEEFITEHYWGYAKVSNRQTNEYQVTHPKWKQHKVLDYKMNVDFKKVYGKKISIFERYKTPFRSIGCWI